MKKSKIIFTMATMASMLALTGCNTEISIKDSEGQETSAIVIETSMEDQTDSQQGEVADIFTQVNEDWNYVLTPDEEFAYLYEVKYDEATSKEYATIVCQGEQGEYWTYETDKYEVGQCSSLEILESPVNVIYLNEGGTIKALNISDGKILWQNNEYYGSGTVCTMDEDDNLYVAGFDSPSLMIIDPNGQTLLRVPQFAEYFWPYDMYIEDNMLTILFDSEENAKVVMDIRDYSYSIN